VRFRSSALSARIVHYGFGLSPDVCLKLPPLGFSAERGLGFGWLTKLIPILTMNLSIRVGNSILLTNSDVRRALPESSKV
jgi:hypothetical protein